jgi:mannonate dehydratase
MIIDVHVHMAGVGDQTYGTERCHLSREFRESLQFKLLLAQHGLSDSELTDTKMQKIVIDEVKAAKKVDKVVLLAMDKVYDRSHNPLPDDDSLPEKTQFYTPNECVAKLAQENPDKVLFGASVHPDRPNALDDLQTVKAWGAKLVKWLPSSQNIDPLRHEYRDFYRKLKELNLPLLCHLGAEHTIPMPIERLGSDRWKDGAWRYAAQNRPDVIVPALQEGATVIAAHCATPVWFDDPDYTTDFIRLMYTAMDNGWNLYADISALALPRLLCPKRYEAAKRVANEKGIHSRLVLGSDFPIWVDSAAPDLVGGLSKEELLGLLGKSNSFDRNVEVLKSLGFTESVFENGAKVLGLV